MMAFHTPVEIVPAQWQSGYTEKHLFMGSCFTENIGSKMAALKFKTDINPFGIVYNPFSLARGLNHLITGTEFTIEDLFRHEGLWHSYRHHGKFSDVSPENCLSKINERLRTGSAFLRETNFLLLTFGTAWVYELKTTRQIVSNCHKVSAAEFNRFRLTVSDIVTALQETLEKLWAVNPGVRVVFTVSPVRHMKDGAVENQLSKATLLLAADTLVKMYGEERCAYFPAYELLMDELRDYRFYAEDMLHPSVTATGFIWEKFRDWLINTESRKLAGKISGLLAARNHRPVYPDSPGYLDFIRKYLDISQKLTSEYPSLDFSEENSFFFSQLQAFDS